MTNSSRGIPSPQPPAQNAPSSPAEPMLDQDGAHPARPRKCCEGEVIEVTDADRLVYGFRLDRHLHFQYLVRHYTSQILHGCKNTHCTTPSCLSCNQRLNTKPFRRPTQLTARALAHFLSSQDDPYSRLCPHELRISPKSLEIQGIDGLDAREAVLSIAHHENGSQIATLLAETHKGVDGHGPVFPEAGNNDKNHAMEENRSLALLGEQRQKKKDVKALGQNLYDTATIIHWFSKRIPYPSSILNALFVPNKSERTTIDTIHGQESLKSGEYARLFDAATAGQANGHATARVNVDPTRSLMQHSHRERKSRHFELGHLDPDSLNCTTNQPKQTVQDSWSEGSSDRRCSSRSVDPAFFDGTSENTKSTKQVSSQATRNNVKSPPGLAPIPAMPTSAPMNRPSLDPRPALRVASHLSCDIMDQMKDEVQRHRPDQSSPFCFSVDYDANTFFRPTTPFVNRSLFFTLSDPTVLLQSFRESDSQACNHSPLPHLNSARLTHTFRDWNRRNGSLIFDSLWIALKALFTPPPELDVQKSPRLKASQKTHGRDGHLNGSSGQDEPHTPAAQYLSDEEAAHIIMICIHALTSLVPVGWAHTWVQLRDLRSWGVTIPNAPARTDFTDGFADPWLEIVDALEYEPALRLANRLVRGIGARICFAHVLSTLGAKEKTPGQPNYHRSEFNLIHILMQHLEEVEKAALAYKKKLRTNQNYLKDPGWTVTSTFVEWLRTIILKKWDGKAVVNRWDNVGVAVLLFDMFCDNSDRLNLRPSMFHMHYLHDRLNAFHESIEYLKFADNPNSVHLLEFPCLFHNDHLVSYFRTINFTSIFKSYERTEQTSELRRRLHPLLNNAYALQLRDRMQITFSDYFVLQVSRDDALKETLDHLWGSEKRLLQKPLKVRLGDDFGEIGIDQGGVTYEFFQLVLSQAFQPDTGMFTVDASTRMAWFQPASLEPLWKFEILGLVFSLAVYNGITLPITFPYAMYHNLLWGKNPKLVGGYPDSIEFIRDGWPALAKSLNELLTWSDGDVADVFMRDYTFSFDAFGRQINVDMQAFGRSSDEARCIWPADYDGVAGDGFDGLFAPLWPTAIPLPDLSSSAWERVQPHQIAHGQSLPETKSKTSPNGPYLVTNKNRERFVKDYILWLTYRSVAPQLEAFRKGFHALIEPKSLHFFTPSTLRSLVEGSQIVDAAAWKKATRYEQGYSAGHPTIVNFWSVVQQYNMDERRKLLEFATASGRVPVTGFESINFVIEKQGPDSELLPSASTCFDKLYLPDYKSEEKLKAKLDIVIHYPEPWGFGIA